MLNLLKWVYRLGIQHERSRIKLLVAQHRGTKPVQPDFEDYLDKRDREFAKRDFDRNINVWHEVDYELSKLLNPGYASSESKPPIDWDN